jgi:hypothetical protein
MLLLITFRPEFQPPWIGQPQGRDNDYPEAWQETAPKGEIRLKAAYRRIRAHHKVVQPDGRISTTGSRAWFLPGKFRFCPLLPRLFHRHGP